MIGSASPLVRLTEIRRRKSQRFISKPSSIPAPVGGWNARDSIADMPKTDAVTMENWWPITSDVMVRKGETSFATGLGSQVNSLLLYNSATASKMFAAAGTSIFNVSAGGAVGAADVTGTATSKYQSVNITTAGGSFLLAVSGAEKLRGYNGTTWWLDGDGTHDITGVDTATIVNINLFKNRIWLIQQSSLNVWYLPINSIAGAATAFPLNSIARLGGHLVAMGTWTLDAGYGVDDYAVFLTSEGEVIVYQLTDPTVPTGLALIGVWQVGAPIGNRCFLKFSGDLLLINFDGVLPLSKALLSSRIDPRVAFTDKIKNAMSTATQIYGSNFGWQLEYFPKVNMLVLNVPVNVGTQQQYVMNTITGSWANFTNWAANCFALFNDDLYFGANGVVCKAWDTFADNASAITGSALQAFSYYGTHGQTKRWTLMRPILQANGPVTATINLNVDFNTAIPNSALSMSAFSAAAWDSATWDISLWGGDLSVIQNWQGVNAIGKCAAPVFRVATNGMEVHWVATDVVAERGWIV